MNQTGSKRHMLIVGRMLKQMKKEVHSSTVPWGSATNLKRMKEAQKNFTNILHSNGYELSSAGNVVKSKKKKPLV